MEQSLNYSSMMRIIFSFFYCPFRLFFTGSAADYAAEVKIDSLLRSVLFWFTYNTLQQKQQYHKINFQQVFSGFERYAINKDRTHA
jgi:hypothetical protein